MTALDQRPAETTARPAETATSDTSLPTGKPAPAPVGGGVRGLTPGRAVGLSCALLGLLLLGFLAYLLAFSSVSEERQQTNLRKTLMHQLADATAPVGPTTLGAPVASLDIPALDINTMVIVQGASSRELMSGPGLLSSSPLPGQNGTSVVIGKSSTFGAPFAELSRLEVGDVIRVTTGLGKARYVVSSFGYADKLPPRNSANRLWLATADTTSWSPRAIIVSADLTSQPVTGGGPRPAISPDQLPGARAVHSSIIPLAGWSQLLLLVAIVGTIGLARWPRWPVVLCLGPVLLTVLWSVYENAAGLLPNVL